MSRKSRAKPPSPFKGFNSSPGIIRLVVLMYVRFPLSLRNVEDLLFERGIDVCHETVRFWWNRFGPMFASEVRRQRVSHMGEFRYWKWHLDEMFVKINGETHYLWRAVDHEGEILESYVTKTRDKKAALAFMKKALKRHGSPAAIVTDGLKSYQAAFRDLGTADKQEIGRPRPDLSRGEGSGPPGLSEAGCRALAWYRPAPAAVHLAGSPRYFSSQAKTRCFASACSGVSPCMNVCPPGAFS